MGKDNIITNPFNIVPPAVCVPGQAIGHHDYKSTQVEEHTGPITSAGGIQYSLSSPVHQREEKAPSGHNSVRHLEHAKPNAKRDIRKSRRHRMNLATNSPTNNNPIRTRLAQLAHLAAKKEKKNSSAAGRSVSRVGRDMRSGSGVRSLLPNGQKDRIYIWREREYIKLNMRLACSICLEEYRKDKEQIDGLVGLVEQFGIGAGEKGREKMEVENGQEGVDIDMDGLEVKMGKLVVKRDDDWKTL
ncbi:hypothetical protein L873DRAFT_1793701 [Choiromyces venosus 120613-1]|uniref:Uncharacterized protein n=1 Tax=Choiromyces venosus 120613-1 TaxID=1336337 RepID=A0A3N4J8M2_9PEZI|nr:hypothetical protein L873DRAFT_1793701 [Choiromyces venosus 120613-1]